MTPWRSVEDALVSSGFLGREERNQFVADAAKHKIDMAEALLRKGRISEEELIRFHADFYGRECLAVIEPSLICPELVRKFPILYLRRVGAVPLRDGQGRLLLAISRPAGLDVLNDFLLVLEAGEMTPVFAPSEAIHNVINTVFGQAEEDVAALEALTDADVDSLPELDNARIEDLLDDSSDAPFIKLVNMILSQAVRADASDVHIEPYKNDLRVRFRLDGVLYDKHTLDKRFHAALVSRIKIMARLNIAEKRLPQDGRMALTLGGRQVDLRVSCLPTALGERIVMRLLEKSTKILSMPELGLSNENFAHMQRLVTISHGMILVTGPTGSGKTTTLYAVLNHINSPEKNILTIEDPVEYQLDGVGQIQVNPKAGLTFSSGLRSIVRQDPDIVLIGEIRDGDTAEIAIQAALTGHLVFSTLHTNDAPSAVTRLVDMGVEPFLVSSVLRAVVAQRLVRRLCPKCKEPFVPSEDQLALEYGFFAHELRGQEIFRPVGCEFCMGTGYKGRMAVYEIMELSETVKSLILNSNDANQIRAQATKDGMQSLAQNGCLKVRMGLTTLAEVLRVTTL